MNRMKDYFKKNILTFALAVVSCSCFGQNADTLSAGHEVDEAVESMLRNGQACLMNNEWSMARKHFTEALEKSPGNLTALFFRAFADEKMGKFNFARADYEQILKVVPTHFETRLCLLLLNQCDSHFTEAFDQANQLVALYPDSASVYFARAGVEKEMEMYELAESDYLKALDIDNNNNDYLLALMETRLYMSKFDLAYADLETLTKRGVARASLQNYFDMCARRIVPKKQKRE